MSEKETELHTLTEIKLQLAKMDSHMKSEFGNFKNEFQEIKDFMNEYYGKNTPESLGMPIRIDRIEQSLSRMDQQKNRVYKILGGLAIPAFLAFGKAIWDVIKHNM